MSSAASTVEWLRAGGIGVGAWVVLAVLVKAGADHTGPARADRPATQPAPRPVPVAPPRPSYPPSTARHAGPPARDEARLLAPAPVSLRKGSPTWT
ncbi:hypothetical protein [Streptomyces sp. EKS3.2]|uniref:hypothetical protein n=1 Tax=Streptomyces sp. EKS3.2 TaxID=3461008 RepID=UPI004043073C